MGPKQKTTAKPENRGKTKSQAGQPKVVKKVCWIGGGRSTLTCKQVRRKLVSGENEKQNQQKQNGRRRIQSMRKTVEKKEKSRMLLHADPQKENGSNEEFSFELANRVDKEEESGLDSEERKAITLKEAFDRTINKLGNDEVEEVDSEELDSERLRSISQEYSDTLTRLLDQIEDSERQYIDSSSLRQGDY